MLLRQRIVFLGSQVDIELADLIISQLLFLDAEDQKTDIKLLISSPGGSTTAGMAIYDAMKLCKADVSTVCMGIAASMAAFILAGGTKGKRFCMPNSKVMIHQPRGPPGSDFVDLALRVKEVWYNKLKMTKTLSRITGKSEEQIEKDSKKDFFMNAWEAKEYGLVDAVIDDGKPGLVAPIVDSSPPPKTDVWYLWRADGIKEEMPSELSLSRSSDQNGTGNEENSSEKAKEMQAPV
ncbi:hypothetical protein HPP92_024414 [Vanilla planifolia]|uniref:ATP-dependent Clp protease proteolytic subunit n=1 Tax=Vanilla planifolia TaxID=51239 RepID=A0A835UB48_VANPL|nr:hypothetical protein HPP92_024414 [Vanilla planifolia]